MYSIATMRSSSQTLAEHGACRRSFLIFKRRTTSWHVSSRGLWRSQVSSQDEPVRRPKFPERKILKSL